MTNTTEQRKRLLTFLITFREDNDLTWPQVRSLVESLISYDDEKLVCVPDFLYEVQRDAEETERTGIKI